VLAGPVFFFLRYVRAFLAWDVVRLREFMASSSRAGCFLDPVVHDPYVEPAPLSDKPTSATFFRVAMPMGGGSAKTATALAPTCDTPTY
jgi:hypothetical protein